ncbi:unnamed protein product [Hyaloperonospora brassicae]|uniref:RxLR effector candidate protein n=1 Tax=Hyaloperonospora brassicae TaxID=162125 RepID=A0AAV0URB5_HYABA|nr:unnamed protein product [Hyaloperonospora brassicae]
MPANEASPMLPLHAGAETCHRYGQPSRVSVPPSRPNWLSRLTFYWLGRLLALGASQPLEASDLGSFESDEHTIRVTNTLRRAMNNSQSLGLSLQQTFFGFNMCVAGACKLTGDCLTFVRPICFYALIQYVENPAPAWVSLASNGYILSFTLLAASSLQTLCLQHYQHRSIREAARVRSALTTLVYEKALALSLQTKSSLGSKKIVDLATLDVDRVFELWRVVHSAWAAPVQLAIGLVLLMQYLGAASLVGAMMMMVLLSIANAAFSSLVTSVSKHLVKCANKRLELITDLWQHIRVIKFYAWESEMLGQVDSSREEELCFRKRMIAWNAFRSAVEQAEPVLVSIGTFAAHSYFESEPLTSSKAFTAIVLFSIIRLPLVALPQVFPLIFAATGSIKRIESFLHLEEYRQALAPLSSSFIADPFFEIRHATFKWSNTDTTGELATKAGDEDALPIQLPNVTISVPRGKLTLIVGAAKSGKSALLAAVLGELQPEYGVVRTPLQRISYAAQAPYVIDASIQDNVLFGASLDTARLHRVVKCCELEKELLLLPNGFQSKIGEGGIPLSDGQKQRLSIARALYPREQELYVFDESLTGLDAHVATRIFNQCFNESTSGLLAGFTRVLSTHSLQFAHLADWIIVMDNMRVVEMGTYQDLTQVKPDGKFASMLRVFHGADDAPVVERATIASGEARVVNTTESGPRPNSCADMLIQDEAKYAGHVSRNACVSYFVSCGTLSVIGAFALLFARQVLSVSAELWLTKWTSNSAVGPDLVFYLSFYAYLGLSAVVLGFVGELCCQYAGLRASKQIHHSLLQNLIKGTLRFFDTHSVDHILDRFSHDMYLIDEKLIRAIVQCATILFALFSMLAIQSSMAPLLLVLLSLVFVCYVSYQRHYDKSRRSLQSLDRVSRDRVHAHFMQTLNGLATIRAFGMNRQSQRAAASKTNESAKALLSLNLIACWLRVRLELLGAVITFAVAFFVSRDYLVLPSAMAGLLLCYSQGMTLLLDSMMRNSVDAWDMMKSVQRIQEYRDIDSEPVTLLAHHYERFTTSKSRTLELRPHWPEHGKIDFVNVYVKYNPDALPALNGVAFSIESGEKVGICGCAGAGKTSLFLALFRMVPFEDKGSSIYIDGVCTTALTLTELRSRIAIIPRDPVLFAASVRFNLDPTRQSTDHQMWNVLRKVGLEAFVQGLRGGLDAEVLHESEIFSIAKQRLVCLARAMLRNSKVLCFDDATTSSSMDHKADECVRSSVRREFAEATVLTITRRVDTVLDHDKVVVLKQGRVVEFGPPSELRDKPNGEFAGMLRESL